MTKKLKISVSSRFYTLGPGTSRSFIELMDFLHNCGFDGTDLDFADVTLLGENWKKELSAVAERAAQLGVRIDFGHLPFKKIYLEDGSEDKETEHKNMLWAIDAAGFLGSEYAVIHPIGSPSAPFTPEAIDKALNDNINYLTPYIEYADKAGVKLVVENMRNPKKAEGCHRFSSHAEELVRLADALGIGICWDFGHAHNAALRPQSEELRLVGNRLKVLHVNDNHGGDDEHLLPFFGTVDWKDAMLGLRDTGFDGYFNFECRMFRLPHNELLRENIGKYAHSLAETLIDMMND